MTYAEVHNNRYLLSLEWITPFLKDAMVLELGGESPFTEKIRALKLANLVTATTHDLRLRSESFGNAWDLILCMEVIEHIQDVDPTQHEFQCSGVNTMLAEVFRMLKPGGKLFLTTPNATSVTVIHHAMRGVPPMLYRPHVREFAPYELDVIVRAAGLDITMRETYDVWANAIEPREHGRITEFIRDFYPNTDPKLLGEDIFMIARKPFLEIPKET